MGNCSSDKSTDTTNSVTANKAASSSNQQKTETAKSETPKTYTEKELEMAKYKLTYFNARGRAEVIRLLFIQAGVEYEDVRVEQEEWQELKKAPKILLAQLPILEMDDGTLAQSKAIARFVARENGLYGKTNLEAGYIDMIIDSLDDMSETMIRAIFEPDQERKEATMKKLKEEVGPMVLGLLEKVLTKNKEQKKDFLVGDCVTLADFFFYTMTDPITKLPDNPLQHFPCLCEHRERIEKLPKVAEWLKKRPETSF